MFKMVVSINLYEENMSSQTDTKDRILDVAEELFAAKGYQATSLRAITSKAGVNLAAVNYHFGSKESLVAEVIIRRVVPLNEERLQKLERADSGEAPLSDKKKISVLSNCPVSFSVLNTRPTF